MARLFAAGFVVLLGSLLSGCGGAERAPLLRPFVSTGGVEGGMSSGNWGDGGSGPRGMRLGCIRGRHFALLITVINRSRSRVELRGVTGDQSHATIMRRVAVQFRPAPPPPKGDLFIAGLRRWSQKASGPLTIAPGSRGWVQSNFVMGNCALIPLQQAITINQAVTLDYRANGQDGSQAIAVPSARIILTRTNSVTARLKVPSWLKTSEKRTLRTVFGDVQPIHITYIPYPKKIAVVFEFSRVVRCRACSSPTNATQPRGRVVRLSFERQSHALGGASDGWAMQFCEAAGGSPPKQACLRR